MKNPFVTTKTKAERRNSILDALSTPAIVSTSPEYQQMQQNHMLGQYQSDTNNTQNTKRLITVTLEQLRPFEGNPRRTKNPAFEEIKASIKTRGLDHAPNITQRPGDSFYTILDGGNTRLQALNELFQETKDLKFWSIECVFKPWVGDADDINSQLNMLIGHLAENEIRGELTFIEKALGVKDVKALYEKMYNEVFSHRKLAEKLTENGYPISHQLIARMEQCLTYLYPHIPNVLLSGLGKPQIEKLLTIHRNAQQSWDKYAVNTLLELTQHFDEIWQEVLSPLDDEPSTFAIVDFQDELIGKITECFQGEVSYETFRLEIDLAEQKIRRFTEKYSDNLPLNSQQEEYPSEPVQSINTETIKEISKPLESVTDSSPHTAVAINNDEEDDDDNEDEATEFNDSLVDMPEVRLDKVINQHFENLGFFPGENQEQKRAEESMANGLEFANCGRQPITNLWRVYPARSHKMEAFSIAVDIADELGFAHLIQHVVHEPVDYRFQVLPLEGDYSEIAHTMHHILSVLATEGLEQRTETLNLNLTNLMLVGNTQEPAQLSDLMLVRLFRLLRIIRYIINQ